MRCITRITKNALDDLTYCADDARENVMLKDSLNDSLNSQACR